jgi:DNA-binding LytR/AlgR family response regulator
MSKSFRVLIVEDEPIIARDVSYMLEDLSYEVASIIHEAKEVLPFLKREPVDLILLDINLEDELTGIDLGHLIKQRYDIPFIYLTSYSDSATLERAKVTQPYGYLVKPIDIRNLKSTISIARYNYQSKLIEQDEKKDDFWLESEFFIRHKGELVRINVANILFAEANDNYTHLYTSEQKFLVSTTLKKVEEKLSVFNFCRVHRSYLINIRHIDKIFQDDVYLKQHRVPISRKYKDDLFDKITTF